MRSLFFLSFVVLLLTGCAGADRNVPLPYPIADALAIPEYRNDLDGMKFFFGDQPHPAVEKSFGIRSTSQRTNTLNKDADTACARVFVSSLLRFKSTAQRYGADAVINIKSTYNHNEVSSRTHYQCAEGAVLAGVALKGEIVRLK